MKRIGNLYSRIYSMDNLVLADAISSKGKAKQYVVFPQSEANSIYRITEFDGYDSASAK